MLMRLQQHARIPMFGDERIRVAMRSVLSFVAVVTLAVLGGRAEAAVPECDSPEGEGFGAQTASLTTAGDGTYTLREQSTSPDGLSSVGYELTGLTCALDVSSAIIADCRVGEKQLLIVEDDAVRWEVSDGETIEWSRAYASEACK